VFSQGLETLQAKDSSTIAAVKPAKGLPVSRRFEPDHTDRAILRLIQKDAALSLADIAKEVGLTPTPCWKRIRRMETEGVITGRVVLLDPEKVGLGVSVFVAIETGDHSAAWIENFAATVAKRPEIVECWRLGGDVDYLLRVVVPDMAAFDTFYRRLTAEVPSLRKVTSRFAMERVKSTTALPI
jgi:Lrp/AsnC family transcriptional regulator